MSSATPWIGGIKESINVAAQAELVQDEASSVGTPITRPSIVDLPLNGRGVQTARGSSSVYGYTINASTGALTPVPGSPFGSTGDHPVGVAVDPTGKFAYVTNYYAGTVSEYSINASMGVLTSLGSIAAGSYPVAIVARYVSAPLPPGPAAIPALSTWGMVGLAVLPMGSAALLIRRTAKQRS
jgi:hypothetical protein